MVGAAAMADLQVTEVDQPGKAALDPPAMPTQPGRRLDPTPGDAGGDPTAPQPGTVGRAVVALMSMYSLTPWVQETWSIARVASGLRCKRATGVGSLEELTTHEGDLHPWLHEYRPPRPSVRRSTSCSRPAASC